MLLEASGYSVIAVVNDYRSWAFVLEKGGERFTQRVNETAEADQVANPALIDLHTKAVSPDRLLSRITETNTLEDAFDDVLSATYIA